MRFLSIFIYALWALGFSLMLVAGGLWWVPTQLGQANQASVGGGAIYLVGAWVLVFNRLPTARFAVIVRQRWFPLQVSALILATAGFIYGALVLA
jgi:hypothetical protein